MVNKLKSILGYLIAALMVPLAFATFMVMSTLSPQIAQASRLVISPWITGGEVAQRISHGAYETRIYRPVFEGLIGKTREGLVQVAWGPADKLPTSLTEDIDYDQDGKPDFQVTLHPQTRAAEWKAYNGNVLRMEGVYKIGDGIGVRMRVTRE